MGRVARALGVRSAAQGLYDLAASLGAPTSLEALGLKETDLGRAADLAVQNPYFNPRPVTRDGVLTLLENALRGLKPQ